MSKFNLEDLVSYCNCFAVFSNSCFLKCRCDFGFVVVLSNLFMFSKMLRFLKSCVFCLAVVFPYLLLCFVRCCPVLHLSATVLFMNPLLSVADYMVLHCSLYHSLPHLFERREHLLPSCNGMNNIFIIKLLTLIYSPSN